MDSIIIFASGTGTNANAIIEYFNENKKAKVSLIVSNNAHAGVIAIAEKNEIPFLIIDKHRLSETLIIEQLATFNPDLIVLAGFILKIPHTIIKAFHNIIINIHPAILPAYGGLGMYGKNVHNAVITAKEKESGITIHYVNENYDEGSIILQARCKVNIKDTADELAQKIHVLEHYYFCRVIEFLLDTTKKN